MDSYFVPFQLMDEDRLINQESERLQTKFRSNQANTTVTEGSKNVMVETILFKLNVIVCYKN